MKTMFHSPDVKEILDRLDQLRPDTQRQWGTMDAAQMMAHCIETTAMATGDSKPPRVFIGRILGPLIKPAFLGESPFRKNSPTAPSMKIADKREFEKEKTKLITIIKKLADGGEAKCTTHPHPFFGPLTPAQWGTSQYKHLDHHFRQFGI